MPGGVGSDDVLLFPRFAGGLGSVEEEVLLLANIGLGGPTTVAADRDEIFTEGVGALGFGEPGLEEEEEVVAVDEKGRGGVGALGFGEPGLEEEDDALLEVLLVVVGGGGGGGR